MSATPTGTQTDQELFDALFHRLAADLAIVIDRPFTVQSVAIARQCEKPTCSECVQVSFRVRVQADERVQHGCVLFPLADAISLASYLMMASDDSVGAKRLEQQPDRSTKEAMLEVGNFIGDSIEQALRGALSDGWKASADGCQGVAAGAKPAFVYACGAELVVATARAQIHTWPAFELRLVLPSSALVRA